MKAFIEVQEETKQLKPWKTKVLTLRRSGLAYFTAAERSSGLAWDVREKSIWSYLSEDKENFSFFYECGRRQLHLRHCNFPQCDLILCNWGGLDGREQGSTKLKIELKALSCSCRNSLYMCSSINIQGGSCWPVKPSSWMTADWELEQKGNRHLPLQLLVGGGITYIVDEVIPYQWYRHNLNTSILVDTDTCTARRVFWKQVKLHQAGWTGS